MAKPTKDLCRGCRDDFYNGTGADECWLFKKAAVVKRWRIGWWTQQDRKENFTRVTTLDCHHAPGKYAQTEKLPQHLGGAKA